MGTSLSFPMQRQTAMNPQQPFANGRPTSPEVGPTSRPTHQANDSAPRKDTQPSGAAGSAPDDKGQRDSKGRFTAGNQGGPGNPYARRTAALRQAMLDAVTEEDVQTIIRQLIQKAREGDVSAARLVLAYAIGKPDKAVDPDTVELQEWNLYQQSRIPSEDFLGVIGGLQAPLASSIARAALPHIQETTAQTLHQMLVDSLAEPAGAGEPGQQAQEPSAPVSELAAQNPVPPLPKPAAQPKPAHKKREQVAQPKPASPPPVAAPLDVLDLRGDEERWLAFLQETLRQSRGSQGHTMPGEDTPPIPNGFFPDGPPY